MERCNIRARVFALSCAELCPCTRDSFFVREFQIASRKSGTTRSVRLHAANRHGRTNNRRHYNRVYSIANRLNPRGYKTKHTKRSSFRRTNAVRPLLRGCDTRIQIGCVIPRTLYSVTVLVSVRTTRWSTKSRRRRLRQIDGWFLSEPRSRNRKPKRFATRDTRKPAELIVFFFFFFVFATESREISSFSSVRIRSVANATVRSLRASEEPMCTNFVREKKKKKKRTKHGVQRYGAARILYVSFGRTVART